MQIVVGVDLEILRQAFIAVCKKSTREEGEDKKKIDVTEILFSPKLGSTPHDIEIKDIADSLNELINQLTDGKDNSGPFNVDAFKEQLKTLSSSDASWIDGITLRIDQAFLYKRTETLQDAPQKEDDEPNPDDPKPDDPKLKNEFCYAFQLTINTSAKLSLCSITLEGLTFAVWDCSYPNVLEKLNIVDISKYIQ
ncbi:MAG: hypothetical protein J5898_00930 [Lachnospiraceae bacterium]|nr:hypothetical protein [Lachnospiraceae bacterium]